MGAPNNTENRLKLVEALQMMSDAMLILEEFDLPVPVEPHLDLAICRLQEALGLEPAVDLEAHLSDFDWSLQDVSPPEYEVRTTGE